jgi:hypothetical protein
MDVQSNVLNLAGIAFFHLLGADNLDNLFVNSSSIMCYQGHHGDMGAFLADIILPTNGLLKKYQLL